MQARQWKDGEVFAS